MRAIWRSENRAASISGSRSAQAFGHLFVKQPLADAIGRHRQRFRLEAFDQLRSTRLASGTSSIRLCEMPVAARISAMVLPPIHFTVCTTASGVMRYSCSTVIG
jgi:hypothetical protein